MRRLLVGEDAFRISRIEEKLRYAIMYTSPSMYHLVSAINIALHDLIGKKLGVPVWRLLGGDRQEIRLYCVASGKKPSLTTPLQTPVKPPWVSEGLGDTTTLEHNSR